MASDFAAGRLFLPLDLLSLIMNFIAAMCFSIAGVKLISERGANLQAIIIFGAITGFIVPMTFATGYLIVQQHFICLTAEPNGYDIAYFSFVTFTTLGFGEITPLGACKALAAVEALTGYLFLGIFTALIFTNLLPERN